MGLIAKKDVVRPPNKPPEWTGTPGPVFAEGTSSNYDFSQNTFDPDGDTLQYTTGTASVAFPSWLTVSSAGILAATAASSAGEVTGIYVNVSDGTNNPVTSPVFPVEVTQAVTSADLQSWGYSLVDSYGADPTGVADSTAAINQCIRDSFSFPNSTNSGKPVLFTAGGVYRVTDTIKIGTFHPGRENDARSSLVGLGGDGTGRSRPKIVLDDNTPSFNTGTLKPVVALRHFTKGATDWPSDPLNSSGVNEGNSDEAFRRFFTNIDIYCGNNADAVGLYMPTAQGSFASEVEIDASNAEIGLWGSLGRNCCFMDLKIIGGVTQIRNHNMKADEGCTGVMFAGLELVGDSRTTESITTADVIPLTVVGGKISVTTTNPVVTTKDGGSTGSGHVCFIDTEVTLNGGFFIDNTLGESLYLRNVYTQGHDEVVTSPAGILFGSSGGWTHIEEYTYCDQTAASPNDRDYLTRNLVDGTISTAAIPISDTSTSADAPADFIARHIVRLPRVDQGAFINVVDNGATVTAWGSTNFVNAEPGTYFGDNQGSGADGAAGSQTAIQTSITSASAAGHNRVFIPGGIVAVSSPGIALSSSTVLFGIDWVYSAVVPHFSWTPSSATATPVIQSDDSSTGTAKLAYLHTTLPNLRGGDTGGGYSFAHLHWRTGKNSFSVMPANDRQFFNDDTYAYNTVTYNYKYSGNAGGKHYSLQDRKTQLLGGNDSRNVLITSTSAPLHIYGMNLEASKDMLNSSYIDTNVEIESAKNVRIYNNKREGRSPTCLINDSTNIGMFGFGRQQNPTGDDIYVNRIQGSSDGIVIGLATWDKSSASSVSGLGMIEEDLSAESAVSINWPDGCAIYKRGTPDDSLTEI